MVNRRWNTIVGTSSNGAKVEDKCSSNWTPIRPRQASNRPMTTPKSPSVPTNNSKTDSWAGGVIFHIPSPTQYLLQGVESSDWIKNKINECSTDHIECTCDGEALHDGSSNAFVSPPGSLYFRQPQILQMRTQLKGILDWKTEDVCLLLLH